MTTFQLTFATVLHGFMGCWRTHKREQLMSNVAGAVIMGITPDEALELTGAAICEALLSNGGGLGFIRFEIDTRTEAALRLHRAPSWPVIATRLRERFPDLGADLRGDVAALLL